MCSKKETASASFNFMPVWERVKEELMENEAFRFGVKLGIGLYQQRVIEAHRRLF